VLSRTRDVSKGVLKYTCQVIKISLVQWHAPVVPATGEAEVRGTPEPSLRPACHKNKQKSVRWLSLWIYKSKPH
jgi:hypothetical protein